MSYTKGFAASFAVLASLSALFFVFYLVIGQSGYVFLVLAGIGGIFITPVLGIAALVSYFVERDRPKAAPALRLCPGCGRAMEFDAIFCKYCGFETKRLEQ